MKPLAYFLEIVFLLAVGGPANGRPPDGRDKPVDASIVIIEPTGQVTPLAMQSTLHGARLHPGQRLRGGYQFDPDQPFGVTQLALIAVEAPWQAVEIVSYKYLCRPGFGGKTGDCAARHIGRPASLDGNPDPHRLIPRDWAVSLI